MLIFHNFLHFFVQDLALQPLAAIAQRKATLSLFSSRVEEMGLIEGQ